MAVNCSRAAWRSSTMLAARTPGGGRASAPSRLSSRSQKRSRLSLSRLRRSSRLKARKRSLRLADACWARARRARASLARTFILPSFRLADACWAWARRAGASPARTFILLSLKLGDACWARASLARTFIRGISNRDVVLVCPGCCGCIDAFVRVRRCGRHVHSSCGARCGQSIPGC